MYSLGIFFFKEPISSHPKLYCKVIWNIAANMKSWTKKLLGLTWVSGCTFEFGKSLGSLADIPLVNEGILCFRCYSCYATVRSASKSAYTEIQVAVRLWSRRVSQISYLLWMSLWGYRKRQPRAHNYAGPLSDWALEITFSIYVIKCRHLQVRLLMQEFGIL
jgi:hypothetical protein